MARIDLATAGYLAGWKLVGTMPEAWTASVFARGADRLSGEGAGMEMLRRNLTRVVGPAGVTRALVREATRSYARYWHEVFRLPQLAGAPGLLRELDAGVEGRAHIDAALDKGRGLILTLPHSGNWDMAGMWLAHHYGGFTTVAERVKPEALYDAFVEFREGLGFEVLPLTGAPTPPFTRLKEVLTAGGIVCLMGERDLAGRGVKVRFFGETTTMPAGPAKLALETGAQLTVAHSWFPSPTSRGPRWGFSVSEPVQVTTLAATAQRVADGFAAGISKHPQDWHALQPIWPADAQWHAAAHPRRRAARAKAQGGTN